MNVLELTIDYMNEATVFLEKAKGTEKKRYVLDKLRDVMKKDEFDLVEPIADGLIDLLVNVSRKRVKLNFTKKGKLSCW